ncbi:hypothetical protein GOP47_0029883 [Adiantum capillus-veneris]|nr:hypothetical protein GOP47_0029883 [Adiantum capillus-veneris]
MSQEQQPHRPVTYGDVFSVKGDLAKQPITPGEAALMQSAEALALGHTIKGGVAAVMQSAATENVRTGSVKEDAHSVVADEGVTVAEIMLPSEIVHTEFVAGQPISSSTTPVPMVPAVSASQDAVTIGEALEAVAVSVQDRPIEPSDASAIQSAEKRATGIPLTMPGGIAATAQAAAELNPRVEDFSKTTLADVLMDASSMLPCDKIVTREDAEKVAAAERRNKQSEGLQEGGVAAALVAAAELNERLQG